MPGALRDDARSSVVGAAAAVAAVLALQLILFPVPLGVWIQGVVLGLLGSLMAVGLGLTYRMNGVINFAQGDLGTAPAVLAVGLVGLSGVNYFLGLATGLVAAVILTAAVEIVVVRRFRRSPRLILTVATIGLSQFLVVVSLLIPRIWGQTPISTAVVNFPWHATWHVAPVVFTADDLVAVVVSLGCLAAVSFWFTRSGVGIAVRATGDRRDRAAMLGIPVGRLQSFTWVVAGVLSFVSIFFQAAIVGMPLDPTYGLTALVTALAALALGNFSDLRAIAVAAVALGVLQQGVAWDDPTNPALGLAVLAGVVFAAILLRQLVVRRTDREAEASLTLAGSVRDLSVDARRLPEVRAGIPLGTAAAFAAACTLPLWLGPGALVDASTLVALAVVGCSVVVLTGWSGQVSLGQMSFAAVGAVVGAVALLDWHWDLSLALLLAGAAAAAVAVVVGIPTLRLDGMFAAVTTLAFALAASGYLLVRAEFSYIPQGTVGVPYLFGLSITSQTSVFELCLGILVVVLAGMHGLRHSRTGRVLRALPANRRAASGYGVSVLRAKLVAFAVSGFIAGLAGCLFLLINQQYEEAPFLVPVSLVVFTSTAVGGLSSALGAVLGAVLVEGSTIFLPPSWQLFPSALGVIIVLIAFPRGLAGLCYDLRDRVVGAIARRHGGAGMQTGTGTGAIPPRSGGGGMKPVRDRLGGGMSLFPLGILFGIELLDQATQSAFNVLTPNIRDAFHLTNAGILLIVAIAGAAALACTLPVAVLADRIRRVPIALVGALVGAAFSIALGAAQTAVVAGVMLAGVSMGQAVIFPTHNSLLADYYPVRSRPRVYSAHRSGVSIGAIAGVLIGAGLAAIWSWRAPFFVFAVPIVIVVLFGLRMREPARGHHEQVELSEQILASERGEPVPVGDPGSTTSTPPWNPRRRSARPGARSGRSGCCAASSTRCRSSLRPSPASRPWPRCSTRRRSISNAVHRAFLIAPIQLFDLLGLAVGATIATRLANRDVSLVFRMLAVASVVASGFAVLFALAPTVPIAFIGNAGIDASLAVVGPGVLASLSLAIPARVRSVGFSIGALFVLPGFLVLPVIGAIGDAVGFHYGLLMLVPLFAIGGLIVASAGGLIGRDVRNVWTSMRTRAQMLADRSAGKLALLAVRDLSAGYDGVAVLDGVEIEIGEGEIVALLGTNGAGKSTLLRAIGGVVEADHGAIVFDGRDITHLPPDEIARLGVAQVPGGEGIFPTLTVEENLRAAAWQGRRQGRHDAELIEEALTLFPVLGPRRSERAGNLSGGQQQMLGLAMAMLTRPKLFLIDELSLGLSPSSSRSCSRPSSRCGSPGRPSSWWNSR